MKNQDGDQTAEKEKEERRGKRTEERKSNCTTLLYCPVSCCSDTYSRSHLKIIAWSQQIRHPSSPPKSNPSLKPGHRGVSIQPSGPQGLSSVAPFITPGGHLSISLQLRSNNYLRSALFSLILVCTGVMLQGHVS